MEDSFFEEKKPLTIETIGRLIWPEAAPRSTAAMIARTYMTWALGDGVYHNPEQQLCVFL